MIKTTKLLYKPTFGRDYNIKLVANKNNNNK